jgi:hypothetical protein
MEAYAITNLEEKEMRNFMGKYSGNQPHTVHTSDPDSRCLVLAMEVALC